MSFLSPITALIAAAVTVPLLVLMYFLKLKRRPQPVSSTLLWKRAVRDLQANAPFQRLRRNILLLLQLLAMAALLMALAQPVLSLRGAGKRYVLLIDCSASMGAVEQDGRTRLEHAKQKARQFVETLRTGEASLRNLSLGEADSAMVVAFHGAASVRCNFTSDKRRLRAAIDAIEQTDGVSRLSEALRVAGAFAQRGGETETAEPFAGASVELFSDGCIADLQDTRIGAEKLNYHRVGEARENQAIVAMRARRSDQRPQDLRIFAALANYSSQERTRDVQLSIDGIVRAVERVSLPAQSPDSDGQEQPGRASVTFDLTHPTHAVVEVGLLGGDSLPADDAAWYVLEPPRPLRILLVGEGNIALSAALEACSPQVLDEVTPAEFDAMDEAAFVGADRYDLVVLDAHVPQRLPPCRYIVFGPPPPGCGVEPAGRTEDQVVLDWSRRHPVLRHVNLNNLYIREGFKMEAPRDAHVLAEVQSGPAMVLVRRQRMALLLVGFDVTQTNWPFEPGFVMFCQNAIRYMGMELQRSESRQLAVGEAIMLTGNPALLEAKLTAPDGETHRIRADDSGTFRFPDTRRTGVYKVATADGRVERFAVNIPEGDESDIAPRSELLAAGRTVISEQPETIRANRDLGGLLLLAALVLVCIEWLVYNSKVRL
ncbi:MAG: vWA domain-containing protein [Phycisphaerae bacterium]